MKSESHARDYLLDLAARGRYAFSLKDAQATLRGSAAAVQLALNRLAKQKAVASPAQGFYVIIPPEYRALGCLPADQFIPDLMERLKLPYYVGLLSAAEYHGAAHQRPQEFQVFLSKNRRPIRCGRVRVAFIARKRLTEVPVAPLNTARGTVLVSSPEATAVDLVGYADHAGGLGQVATVLSELAERLDPGKLAVAAATAPIPWAQRLGYLLDHLGFTATTPQLKDYVRRNAKESTVLLTRASRRGAQRNQRWKLYVNAKVEAEL